MRLQHAIISAIRRAVENAGDETAEVIGNMQAQEAVREPFSAAAYHSEQNTYSIPSFDNGGAPRELPVKSGKGGQADWTPERTVQHIADVFGTYIPSGKTYYGVQTPGGVYYVDSIVGGKPHISAFTVEDLKKDVQGHWTLLGNTSAFAQGRYILSVTGQAPVDHPPQGPNIAIITDLQGNPIGDKGTSYTSYAIGTRFVFDVPSHFQTASGQGEGGSPAGTSPLGHGDTPLIPLRCSPRWDTNPLTDPAYAGMTDDDLFRLFLNLCNARALDNLDLNKRYIEQELVPLYTGPKNSTRRLSQYSRHNIQHFQEDLRLLRTLMLALNKLTAELGQIKRELDDLLLTHHRVSYPLLFDPNQRLEIFWPTPHPPAERDRPRVEALLKQAQEKNEQAKQLVTGILLLVRENPLLTQFITGLEIAGNSVDVPDSSQVKSELADIQDPAHVQKQILERLESILRSIERARLKLCLEPERVLDVPLVYQPVQELLKGVNERFDRAVREGIAHHQRLNQWTDIGLTAAGIALLVGGGLISLFGGPAGIAVYLGIAGTALNAVMALRSIDEAIFKTALSEASVERGHGMETLEAAQTARIWAWVNSVLTVVDIAAGAAKGIVAARRATALATLSKGAEVFEESAQAAKRIPFEEIFKKALSHKEVLLSESELAKLQALGTSRAELGRIAEEVAERAATHGGEYVSLATKVRGNQGIDLILVRRRLFERVFGRLATSGDAGKILAQAQSEQVQQLLKLLEESGSAENLIAIEVKFSRLGVAVEDVLRAARGGVQFNRQWFASVLKDMLKATAHPEVRATGRLLEAIIGPNAQSIERLTRIGISLDANGAFKFVQLSDEIINTANKISPLYWKNWNLVNQMLKAERLGNQAKADRLLKIIQAITKQIDELDAAINQAKRGLSASQRVKQSLETVQKVLAEISALQAERPTPGIIDALHIANATARLHLEIIKYSTDEAEAEYDQARKRIAEASKKQQEFEQEIAKLPM